MLVGPLGRDAIDALLAREVQTAIPPPRVSEIADMSGGNPLFAIEIGRGIERGEIVHQPGRPLNVPATLRDLVAHRLSRLEPPVQEALFVAAAVSDPTVELLDAVIPAGDVDAAMERAVDAGVVELRDGQIAFRHPLFASTVYHAIGPDRRRALHRQLADEVQGAQERARHLSLAAEGPDETVAAALDEAARPRQGEERRASPPTSRNRRHR